MEWNLSQPFKKIWSVVLTSSQMLGGRGCPGTPLLNRNLREKGRRPFLGFLNHTVLFFSFSGFIVFRKVYFLIIKSHSQSAFWNAGVGL